MPANTEGTMVSETPISQPEFRFTREQMANLVSQLAFMLASNTASGNFDIQIVPHANPTPGIPTPINQCDQVTITIHPN